MLDVYAKNLKKMWLANILGPILILGFISLIAMGWSSMQQMILDRAAAMNNPIYVALLGDLSSGSTHNPWQLAIFMYAIGTVNILLLFVSVFIPSKLLREELDKKTLDVIFSYPIHRWLYLLEKMSVYFTYSLLYPLVLIISIFGSTYLQGEEIDIKLVINSAIGIWFLFLTLGSITILCVVLFLDSNKALAAAGGIMITMYILENFGIFIPSIKDFQIFSLFHYLKTKTIAEAGMLPLDQVVIVLGIGGIALISALFYFDKREFVL